MHYTPVTVRGSKVVTVCLDIKIAQLVAVSPQATLARGYAIVRDQHGDVVRSTTQTESGDALEVQVADGKFEVVKK